MILLSACSSSQPSNENNSESPLTISAASSLQNVLNEIEDEYIKEHPNRPLVFNFGGSGALMQQIEKGAPIDLFIFADIEKSNYLIERDLVKKKTVTNFLGNQLVLIVPNDSTQFISKIEDLTDSSVKRIAIGTPESVPAGLYSKQSLQSLELWNKLEEKIVRTKDVRQVLTYVETGNVEAGFVYKTDAIQSRKVKIATQISDSMHDKIVYSTGIVKATKQTEAAKGFLEFLLSDKAKEIYLKYGFIVLE